MEYNFILVIPDYQIQFLMALNREALDKARALQNLQPLSDDEFNALNGSNGGASEEEKAALLKQQQEEDSKKKEEEARLLEEKRLKDLEDAEKNKPQLREPTDEELLERVSKITGKTLQSWDDLKPREVVDAEAVKQERDADKISFGLKNKLIKPKELEGFISDSKDPKDLVYRHRLQEAKKEDPTLDEAEFKAEFEEEFGIDQKPDSRRYKNGQQTLNRLATSILQSTYGSVYELEGKYSQFETHQTQQRAIEQKVKEGTVAYTKALSNVRSQLSKITVQFNEGEEYTVEAKEDILKSIDSVIEQMSDPKFATGQIVNGYTEEQLNEIASTAVLKNNWKSLAKEIAVQHLRKHAAGTKGITTLPGGGGNDTVELTPEWEKMKTIIDQNKTAPVQAN